MHQRVVIVVCFTLATMGCNHGIQSVVGDDHDLSSSPPSDLGGSPDLGAPADLAEQAGPTLGQISLVAGLAGGPGNRDGVGPGARFRTPALMVADGAGNLYVADSDNSTIRRIELATATVTTIAGLAGVPGSDEGIGTAARFRKAQGLALDGKGNLYVADGGNQTIRQIVLATGRVTTIAGATGVFGSSDGVGLAARFSDPTGMVFDAAGNLFVSDTGNATIRKIAVNSLTVTTVAGTAGAFSYPYGLALDGADALYVADVAADKVSKVDLATGVVTTVAGGGGQGSADGIGGAAHFSNPFAVALGSDGNLYITDADNHTIRQLVIATGAVTTFAGAAGTFGDDDGTGAAARFGWPLGIIADQAGNLYVSDENRQTIRKISIATRMVTTIAGAPSSSGFGDGAAGVARFNTPVGVASDGMGSVYVADSGSHTIRSISLATGAVTTLAGTAGTPGSVDGKGISAQFCFPTGVAADQAGNLYVADSKNDLIRKIAIASGAVTTFAGGAVMPGGADGKGTGARFNTPQGITADGCDALYVADTSSHTIRRIDPITTAVTTVAGTAGISGDTDDTGSTARFNLPTSLACDGHGNLYVADSGNRTIRKIVLATANVVTFAGATGLVGATDGIGAAARFANPVGLGADRFGNLFIADADNHAIRRIDLASATVSTAIGTAGIAGIKVGPLPGALNQPSGVAVLASGELVVVDSSENAVLEIR